jgi:hypothetical protein
MYPPGFFQALFGVESFDDPQTEAVLSRHLLLNQPSFVAFHRVQRQRKYCAVSGQQGHIFQLIDAASYLFCGLGFGCRIDRV